MSFFCKLCDFIVCAKCTGYKTRQTEVIMLTLFYFKATNILWHGRSLVRSMFSISVFYCLFAFFQAFSFVNVFIHFIIWLFSCCFVLFLSFFLLFLKKRTFCFILYSFFSLNSALPLESDETDCSNMRIWHQTDDASLPYSTDTIIPHKDSCRHWLQKLSLPCVPCSRNLCFSSLFYFSGVFFWLEVYF